MKTPIQPLSRKPSAKAAPASERTGIRFPAFLFILLAVLCPASLPAQNEEKEKAPLATGKDEWTTYRNPRFGMVLPVPPGMIAQRPPDNGGGQAFRSADGKAELIVWGSFNVDHLGDITARWKTALLEPGRTITYKRQTEKWFVISGTRKDGTAFYERYDADKNHCAGWLITYPQAEEKTYSALIDRIAKGYKANLGKGEDHIVE